MLVWLQWLEEVADTLSVAQRSELMSRVRNKNSKAEIAVRSLIHSLGFRFRLHERKLPGRPDIVLPRLKKVVFVNGCFWHRHDCALGRLPKSRLDFWVPKLNGNRERDEANRIALTGLGWDLMVVWECQIKDVDALRERLAAFLGA